MKGKSAGKAPPQTPMRMATAEDIPHAIEGLTPKESVPSSSYARNRLQLSAHSGHPAATATTRSRRPLLGRWMDAGTCIRTM